MCIRDSSRSIVKDKVLVSLREYTGPADPNNTNLPSTFKIARETLMTAQRLLLDTGNLNMFHQSIGSLTLLDDYRRWRDRVFIDELANLPSPIIPFHLSQIVVAPLVKGYSHDGYLSLNNNLIAKSDLPPSERT